MVNFCTKHKGTIAVFLTLILVPTFIFSGVMIDGSRIMASKNMISGAGDLAMNAALSNYNEKLNDWTILSVLIGIIQCCFVSKIRFSQRDAA